MPAPIIPIALALAQFAPALFRFFEAGNESTAVADKVAEIAATVTGSTTPEGALGQIAGSLELQAKFKQAVMERDLELERIYIADIQSARQRDVELAKAGQRNRRADFLAALAIIVIVILVLVVWQDPTINEYVKGIFTLVLGRFLGYLDGIYNFEFGTSRGSEQKQRTLDEMLRRKDQG